MNQAFYRKYRPQTFDELIGQPQVSDVLKAAVVKDSVHHAYLFTGPRGTGKTSTARILARSINCIAPVDGSPCNSCDFCMEALDGSLTDFIEIDAASHGSVDDARDLVDKANFAPIKAKKKVYIIDEVHMLSKPAFNALLKIIEEPPDHVSFILATTESHKVLDTIKSRCHRFEFHLLNDNMIVEHLRAVAVSEGVDVETEALELVAEGGKGSVRDSLSLMEQVVVSGMLSYAQVVDSLGLARLDIVKKYLSAVRDKRLSEALSFVRDLYSEGSDLYQFTCRVITFLRQDMLRQVSDTEAESEDLLFTMRMLSVFLDCLDQQRDPIIAQLPLETATVSLCKAFSAVSSSPDLSVDADADSDPGKVPVEKSDNVTLEVSDPVSAPSVKLGSLSRDSLISALEKPSLRQIIKQCRLELQGEDIHIYADCEFSKKKLDHTDSIGSLNKAFEQMGVRYHRILFMVDKDKTLKSDDVVSVFG